MKRAQLSVPIDEALRAYLKQRGKQEERTVAAVVRRILTEAQRQSQSVPAREAA